MEYNSLTQAKEAYQAGKISVADLGRYSSAFARGEIPRTVSDSGGSTGDTTQPAPDPAPSPDPSPTPPDSGDTSGSAPSPPGLGSRTEPPTEPNQGDRSVPDSTPDEPSTGDQQTPSFGGQTGGAQSPVLHSPSIPSVGQSSGGPGLGMILAAVVGIGAILLGVVSS